MLVRLKDWAMIMRSNKLPVYIGKAGDRYILIPASEIVISFKELQYSSQLTPKGVVNNQQPKGRKDVHHEQQSDRKN